MKSFDSTEGKKYFDKSNFETQLNQIKNGGKT